MDYYGEEALGMNPKTSTFDIHRIIPLMYYSGCEVGRKIKTGEEDFYLLRAHE